MKKGKNHNIKVDKAHFALIKRLLKEGAKQTLIAKTFAISGATVSRISKAETLEEYRETSRKWWRENRAKKPTAVTNDTGIKAENRPELDPITHQLLRDISDQQNGILSELKMLTEIIRIAGGVKKFKLF